MTVNTNRSYVRDVHRNLKLRVLAIGDGSSRKSSSATATDIIIDADLITGYRGTTKAVGLGYVNGWLAKKYFPDATDPASVLKEYGVLSRDLTKGNSSEEIANNHMESFLWAAKNADDTDVTRRLFLSPTSVRNKTALNFIAEREKLLKFAYDVVVLNSESQVDEPTKELIKKHSMTVPLCCLERANLLEYKISQEKKSYEQSKKDTLRRASLDKKKQQDIRNSLSRK